MSKFYLAVLKKKLKKRWKLGFHDPYQLKIWKNAISCNYEKLKNIPDWGLDLTQLKNVEKCLISQFKKKRSWIQSSESDQSQNLTNLFSALGLSFRLIWFKYVNNFLRYLIPCTTRYGSVPKCNKLVLKPYMWFGSNLSITFWDISYRHMRIWIQHLASRTSPTILFHVQRPTTPKRFMNIEHSSTHFWVLCNNVKNVLSTTLRKRKNWLWIQIQTWICPKM